MEKTTSQKIRLGIFVIIGLALFIVTVYFIGQKQKLFGGTNDLYTVFNNVNGLELGNNVRYSGVNVGTVREIVMINDTTIKVTMMIDEDIFHHIKKNAIATIKSDGLVGNMIVNIVPGKAQRPSVEPGDKIASATLIRTEDILNTLNTTNQNAAKLSADLLQITQEILKGSGTVGTLLKDTIMANDLKNTVNSLKLTAQETSHIIGSINKKNSLVGVLNDSVVAKQIRNVVVNLEKTSTETDKAVANLNKTIINIKDGKGALNYLANDPKLVHQIDSTMTNINKASILLNENLEAMKHNFLTKGYFKDQEKQKKKTAKQ